MGRETKFIFDNKVSISVSEDMIEQVLREFEAEHPGQNAKAMSGEEFAERMLKKIRASAEIVQ